MSTEFITADITAQNTWSDWLVVPAGYDFSVSIKGTFSATVTVQLQENDGDTTYVVLRDDITESGLFPSLRPLNKGAKIRAGVATGDYTSGTVEIEIARHVNR